MTRLPVSRISLLATDAVAAATTLVACLIFIATGIHLQSLVHVNHDVAWITHSAAWLIDGAQFGTDILDPNPPLAWFLMLPPATIARAGLLPEIIAIKAWCWLLAVVGLLLSAAVLRQQVAAFGRIGAAGLLIASTAVVVLLPIGNFGQREIVAFGWLLPYVFLLAGRLQGGPSPGRALGLLAGIAAGIGIGLKPFLLAAPALAELLHVALTRRLRVLIRHETVAMALMVVAYLLAIVIFAPAYLESAMPLIRAVYWAYDDAGYLVVRRFMEAVMPGLWALGLAFVTFSFTRVHAVLTAAAAGFTASYWIQHKGFPYHAYPIVGASCVLLVYTSLHAVGVIRRNKFLDRVRLRLLAVVLVASAAIIVLHAPFAEALRWYEAGNPLTGAFGQLRQLPIDRLRALGVQPADYIYALSTHPNPGFPTVNYLGVRWAGNAVTQFIIPAWVRRGEIHDADLLERVERATALQRDMVINDLRSHRPKYVFVEYRQWRLGLAYRKFDDLAFYGADPVFAKLWTCYQELPPLSENQLRLFRLRDHC